MSSLEYFRSWWSAEVRHDTTLTAGTKVVAWGLTKFWNRDSGTAWPSQETLATECGMSEDGVRKAIKALREADFIRTRKRGFGGSLEVFFLLPEDFQSGLTVPEWAKCNPVRAGRTIRPDGTAQSGTSGPGNSLLNPSDELDTDSYATSICDELPGLLVPECRKSQRG